VTPSDRGGKRDGSGRPSLGGKEIKFTASALTLDLLETASEHPDYEGLSRSALIRELLVLGWATKSKKRKKR